MSTQHTTLRRLPLTSAERALGVKKHFALSSAPAAKLSYCSVCRAPLSPRNQKGLCWYHITHRYSAGHTNFYEPKAGAHEPFGREPNGTRLLKSTIETTRLNGNGTFCRHCRTEVVKLVCPNTWPILTTAVVCQLCGRVHGYVDDQSLPGFLLDDGKPKETPPRDFVVSHRTAHRVYHPDQQRELTIWGLGRGIEISQIAEDLGVSEEYVHAVGVNEGLIVPAPKPRTRADELRELLAEGKTPHEIAKLWGYTTASYVSRLMRDELGIKRDTTQADRIRARFREGVRQCDIAREFNVEPSYVSRTVRGIERTYHEIKDRSVVEVRR